jgi:hypothetical protein
VWREIGRLSVHPLTLGGYTEPQGVGTFTMDFGHNAVLFVADKVINAVKSGAIKHFFLVGGCDGAFPGQLLHRFHEANGIDNLGIYTDCKNAGLRAKSARSPATTEQHSQKVVRKLAENTRCSFSTAVRRKYEDDIEKAVSAYVEECFSRLDLQSHKVKNPDEAFLENLRFHRIIPYDAPNNKVVFDVVVIAGIAIFETSHSQATEGEAEKWFRISCEAELNNGLQGFRIIDIDEYDHQENKQRGLLSDTLVPILYKDELEQTAESILKQYYPQALEKPVPVDVCIFAKNMGLTVKEARLSRSGTIFGEMIFSDCSVEYYDTGKRRFDTLDVKRKTILVDPEVYFLRTLGSWNNTVIHECVHWEKHRKFFELERMYNENVRMIRCQATEKATDDGRLA